MFGLCCLKKVVIFQCRFFMSSIYGYLGKNKYREETDQKNIYLTARRGGLTVRKK